MEPASLSLSLWKMFSALAIVLAIMMASLFLIKKVLANRALSPNDDACIKIVASSYLGPKNSLVLVDVLGKLVLVGISQQQLSHLATFEDETLSKRLIEIKEKSRISPLQSWRITRWLNRTGLSKPPKG